MMKSSWCSVASAAVFAPVVEREEWPTAPLCWWTKNCRISPRQQNSGEILQRSGKK